MSSSSVGAPTESAPPGGSASQVVLCPCCSCEVHCPPPAPKPLKTARVLLTDEERLERKRAGMRRWYHANKEGLREKKAAYQQKYYAENREAVLARLREVRRRQSEAKKAAKAAAKAEACPEGAGSEAPLLAQSAPPPTAEAQATPCGAPPHPPLRGGSAEGGEAGLE